jgi:hypothetical protein
MSLSDFTIFSIDALLDEMGRFVESISCSKSEFTKQQAEGGRVLSATGIVQVIAWERRTPAL